MKDTKTSTTSMRCMRCTKGNDAFNKKLSISIILVIFFLIIPIRVWAYDSRLLWLVNSEHTLDFSYHPEKLIHVYGYPIHHEAGEAFLKMQDEMKAAGVKNLRLQSAYRPYGYQRIIFDEKVSSLRGLGLAEDEAKVLAARSVAMPGSSEHQTGLAVDVSLDGQLSGHFGTTEAGVWLQNNCDKYGFVVRYPKGKTPKTQIIYEPWHLRYVGTPHASYMAENGLCLEEYIAYVKKSGMILYWLDDKSYYKVSFSQNKPESQHSSLGPDGRAGYIITELKDFRR